ncbi:hypothetical protein BC830DRAFT_1166288 [Chytriomyces sp. MP71]|nr:hypothetical protein BC830DRAFT_1166288 [Chytriomyces sp. MP71]
MGRNIEIPLQRGDEVLIIDTDDLGVDSSENDTILNILTNEKVPMHLYIEFAKEFHRLGISDYVQKALEMGAERGAAEFLRDNDYVKILTTLTLHYTESASLLTKSDQSSLRSQLISKATEYLNKADAIDPRNLWTAVSKGTFYLANNRVADALKVFAYALELDPTNVSALLGLGAAQSRSQDFKSALKTYQKVLTLYPTMQPDPRLAIGICYYRLHMAAEARAAFSRATELNPSNADALALLARLEWNQARSEGNATVLEEAVEKVKRAFEVDRKNSSVLNLVGEGLFFKGLFDQVEIVSKASIAHTDSNSVKAEAYGLMAKALHSQGKHKEALDMYLKAATLNPASLTYQYGLGQMHIFAGEHQKALDCFEKVLAKEPDNVEAIKKVASVCSEHPKLIEKSLLYFGKLQSLIKKFKGEEEKNDKESIGLFPDPVMQVELARIYEGINPAIALKGYLNAQSVLEASGIKDSLEILSNIGVLYHRDAQKPSDFETAKSYYERALAAADSYDDSHPERADLRTTVLYNLARLQEQTGQGPTAAEKYASILEKHPSYYDCYLRLAAMAPNFEVARTQIRKGLIVDRKSTLLMMGASFFEDTSNKQHLRDARKSFEEVLQKADKHDHYALCNIGNIYLVIARFDPPQKETHVKKALEFFDKAVRVDNKNVFGAAGVGICLAELKQFEQAREVFTQVLEGVTHMPSISISLAHVLVELGQTKLAISHYERVLKKSLDQNAYVLQCLARVHYIVAKSEKDPSAMLRSLDCLQRALRIEPSRWALHYDLALVKQQYAQIMNDQPSDKRTVEGLQKALEGLHASRRIFDGLGTKSSQSSLGYDIKQARERASYCKDVQRSTEKRIHESTVLERERTERLRAIREAQQKVETAEQEAVRLAREKEEREREEIERKRRELMKKVQEENERQRELAKREEDEEAERPKKRKKQEAVSDASEPEGDDDASGEGEKKEKRKRIRFDFYLLDPFALTSSSFDFRKRKEKKSKGEDGEGSRSQADDDDAEEAAARVGRPSNLSRAVIDSDEDE